MSMKIIRGLDPPDERIALCVCGHRMEEHYQEICGHSLDCPCMAYYSTGTWLLEVLDAIK